MSLAARSPDRAIGTVDGGAGPPGPEVEVGRRGLSGQRCGDPRRWEARRCGGVRGMGSERSSMSSCEVEELRILGGGTGAMGGAVTSDHRSWRLLRDRPGAAELYPSARLSTCG